MLKDGKILKTLRNHKVDIADECEKIIECLQNGQIIESLQDGKLLKAIRESSTNETLDQAKVSSALKDGYRLKHEWQNG